MERNQATAVWRTFTESEEHIPKRRPFWRCLKMILRIAVFIWRILKLLAADGQDS